MNVVWLTMAVGTSGLAVVSAAPDLALGARVAIDTTFLVRERLKVASLVVLFRNVAMAIMASNIRMRRGVKYHIVMAFQAIDFLGLNGPDKQQNNGRDENS